MESDRVCLGVSERIGVCLLAANKMLVIAGHLETGSNRFNRQTMCVHVISEHQQVCFCSLYARGYLCTSGIHLDVLCVCVCVYALWSVYRIFPLLCLFLYSAAAVWSNSHEWHLSVHLCLLFSFFWHNRTHSPIPANGDKTNINRSIPSSVNTFACLSSAHHLAVSQLRRLTDR